MDAITPAKALELHENREFPDFVIEAFNELIQGVPFRPVIRIEQEDVIMRMMSLNPEITRQEIFDKHYLDVENYYKRAGWKVQYFKPAYFEDWKAYWEFRI